MPPIVLSAEVLDYDNIKNSLCDSGDVSNCTHPAGHCFGSDGGSGIPENLKVAPGRGGEQEVWKLNAQKTKILTMAIYEKCQYCGKLNYVKDKEEQQAEI